MRSFGLEVDEVVDLHDSNRLTARLLPADLVARIAPAGTEDCQVEIDRVLALHDVGAPVGLPDPRVPARVHERDGFAITFWQHHAARDRAAIPADEYAAALARLHEAMRRSVIEADPVGRRVDSALALLADPGRTPRLAAEERAELQRILTETGARVAAAGAPQVLHGEPHPGNLLDTPDGVLVIDLETLCTGPVEFDLAHAPVEVAAHYPGADAALLADCRVLARALATTWRWDREDALPGGELLGVAWLREVRQLERQLGGRSRGPARRAHDAEAGPCRRHGDGRLLDP